MDKAKKGARRALVDVAYVGLYTVITFLFVFFLWNWIVPVIFGLPKITIKGGKPTPLGVGWIA